jgi:hypothetical protein
MATRESHEGLSVRRPTLLLAAKAFIAAIAVSTPAPADVVDSQHVLRIRFTVAPPFSLTPDLLLLNFGAVQVLQPYTTRTARLYDGAALLSTSSPSSFGSHVGPLLLNPAHSWRDPLSPWTFDSPGVADFEPILAGTIQGRIDWRPLTGSVDVPLEQVALRLGRATGQSSWTLVTPSPAIASVEIVPYNPCTADYDQNGLVAPADVAQFVQAWIRSIAQGTLVADLDGNGLVEPADLARFVSLWYEAVLNGCPP